MAIISFDMQRVGRTIAALRRERNMTQMQLADDMGVSFQAVSNWERGQSMPDISKLPELAALFGTTIDHLLGRSSPVIHAAVQDTLAEAPVAVEDLVAAAPLLTPRQIDAAADALAKVDPLPALDELLPFLHPDRVDALVRRAAQQDQDISPYLPFASTDALNEVLRICLENGQDFSCLMPFLPESTLTSLARTRMENGQSITCMLPFLPTDVIDQIALTRLKARQSIGDLSPFMSSDLINRLADQVFKAE